MKGCISLRYILIQYCFYFGRIIIHVYTTRYSTIDELTTEQPQQNHTQSSHLAAKLLLNIVLLNIISIVFFKEIKLKNITVNCLIIK